MSVAYYWPLSSVSQYSPVVASKSVSMYEEPSSSGGTPTKSRRLGEMASGFLHGALDG